MVRDLIIILGDQLSLDISSLEKIRKNEDKILMMEVSNEIEYANHHKKKLVLIFSAMRHFANELKKNGFDITYVEFDKSEENFTKELERQCKKFNPKSIKITHPSEYRVLDEVKKWEKVLGITVTVLEDSRFFCKMDEFSDWANSRKELKMELFYQKMRKKYNILMDNEGKPVGGKWNYDIKNRNRLPKNHSKIPNPLVCKPDKITKRVISQLQEKHTKHFGDLEPFWFATTREDAVKSLEDFIQNRLEFFGPYEDAMKENEKFLYHSVLSVYLNIGLLNPRDVIQKVLENKDLPIESIEGFVRQIIGWREFVRGIYQNYDDKLENTNFFNHQRKLTDDWYNGTTGIDPIDDAIKDVNTYGYAHHIIRLMHLSNIMTLSQLHPKEIYKWFMEMFVDSSDWVMSPNVFGMGTYSDGGIFSTKPYICGSNYIIKMSNYKKGNWSDIVDGLYWSFIHNNKEVLSKNPRMGMVMMSYRKLKEERKDYLLKIANEFIAKKTT